MGVSKVILGNQTVMDISEDNIAPNKMLRGTSAHNSAGEPIVGTILGQEWEDVTEAEYMAEEATSDPDEETGVYDPEKMYFIEDMDMMGWVVTDALTATANATTSLTFVHASIHPDSFIRIAAEDVTTRNMPQQGNNNTHPIFAKIVYQNEGSCQIAFDLQPHNTDFWLYINNSEDTGSFIGTGYGIKHRGKTYGGIPFVDTQLNDNSNNPVTNHGIVQALKNIVGVEIGPVTVQAQGTSLRIPASGTNSAIHTNSEIHLKSDNGAGSSNTNAQYYDTPIWYISKAIYEGYITFELPALPVITDFYLQVINDSLS